MSYDSPIDPACDRHRLYVGLSNIADYLDRVEATAMKKESEANRRAIQNIQTQLARLKESLRQELYHEEGLQSVLSQFSLNDDEQTHRAP